jgi:hypothetical protein
MNEKCFEIAQGVAGLDRVIHKPSVVEPYLPALEGFPTACRHVVLKQPQYPLLHPVSVVFLAVTGIYGTSLRGL